MALFMVVSFFHVVFKLNDQCFDFEGRIYFQTVLIFRILHGIN